MSLGSCITCALVVAATTCAGCTNGYVIALGAGGVTGCDEPSGVDNFVGAPSLDVSWTPTDDVFPVGPTLGAYATATDGQPLSMLYVSVPTYFLVYLKPMVGVWTGGGMSEDSGLFAGLKLGFTWIDGSVEFGWLTLHDVGDDEDLRLRTVRVAAYQFF